ncbi:MAG: CvpA family protein [Desulfomonilaceae bacterium]
MNSIEAYNAIDLFVMGTLLVTLILGIWKGFVRSLTALASLVAGVGLAIKYYPTAQAYLSKISSLDPQVSMVLAMIVIFIAVQVVFVVIRRILEALIDLTRLTWLDRIFGAVMGIVAGLLVVAAAVQVMLIGIPDWPLVKTSKLVKPVDQLTGKAVTYAPKQVRDQWHSLMTKWKGTTQELAPPTPQRQAAPSPKAPAATPGLVK